MQKRQFILSIFSLALTVFPGMDLFAQVTTTTSTTSVQMPRKYYIIDLYSSDTVDIYYDTLTWRTMNRVTNQPVEYYIIRYSDPSQSPDTVHGVTGIIVNDLIVRTDDNKWAFNEKKVKWDGKEMKMKDKYGRKVKWEEGNLKIKDWNNKYKSEKDGAKYKEEWDKIKWKEDGTKVEVGTQKTKVKTKE
jgi:hypothetical protein